MNTKSNLRTRFSLPLSDIAFVADAKYITTMLSANTAKHRTWTCSRTKWNDFGVNHKNSTLPFSSLLSRSLFCHSLFDSFFLHTLLHCTFIVSLFLSLDVLLHALLCVYTHFDLQFLVFCSIFHLSPNILLNESSDRLYTMYESASNVQYQNIERRERYESILNLPPTCCNIGLMYFNGNGENLFCFKKSYKFCSSISNTRHVWFLCWKHSNARTKLNSSAFSWLRRERIDTSICPCRA